MGLDLHRVAAQLDALAGDLQDQRADREARLARALETLAFADGDAINAKRTLGRFAWPVPAFPRDPKAHHSPAALPTNYRALASDGSHIDVDRHISVRCALVNISKVLLRYGSLPDARLESTAHLYTSDAGLALVDPDGAREQLLDGDLMGIKRSIDEVVALAELAEETADEVPTLAVLDGSLVLWGATIQAYPDYVRKALINGGLLPAFDRLKAIAKRYPLALAAYVSFPSSTGIVDALRLAICPYDLVNCDHHCGRLNPGRRPCDSVGGLVDRELFGRILAPGERSDVLALGC